MRGSGFIRPAVPLLMRSLAIAIGLMLPTLPSAAQVVTIPVRGGEHADYTRLVLRLPEGTDWQLTQSGRSAELIFSGADLRFDLSQSFARIPRTRLRGLRESDGGLVLDLACDCPVSASEDLPQTLVIDITTAPSPLPAPAARRPPARPDLSRPGRAPTDAGFAQAAGRGVAAALRETGDPSTPARSLLLDTLFAPPMMPHAVDLEDQAVTPPASQADTVAELGQALALAVSQGLLVPSSAQPGSGGELPEIATVIQPLPPDEAQLAVLDSISRARGAEARILPSRQTGDCPNPSVLNPAEWASPGQPVADWSDLFDPLDRLNPEGARRTAGAFLARGFGAEARQVLSLLHDPGTEDSLLVSLSYLIDLDALPAGQTIPDLARCGDMGMFWHFLHLAPQGPVPELRPQAIVTAVRGLPDDLRRHLGPQALGLLVTAGHLPEAHVLRDALARVTDAQDPALAQAQTALAMSNATPDRMDSIEHAHADTADAQTLILLLRHRLERDLPATDALVAHATDQIFALRGTANGRELLELLARAQARRGSFEAAFALANQRATDLTPENRHRLREALWRDLVQAGDAMPDTEATNRPEAQEMQQAGSSFILSRMDADILFLSIVFSELPWQDIWPDDLAEAMATRLERLGFATQAQLLRPAPPTSEDPEPLAAAGSAESSSLRSWQEQPVPSAPALPERPANQSDQTGQDLAQPMAAPGDTDDDVDAIDATPDALRAPDPQLATPSGPDLQAPDIPGVMTEPNATEDALLRLGYSRVNESMRLRENLLSLLDQSEIE